MFTLFPPHRTILSVLSVLSVWDCKKKKIIDLCGKKLRAPFVMRPSSGVFL